MSERVDISRADPAVLIERAEMGTPIVVTRLGMPAVAIIPADAWIAYQEWSKESIDGAIPPENAVNLRRGIEDAISDLENVAYKLRDLEPQKKASK